VAAVESLADQLRATEAEAEEEAPIFIADSGLYSAENVARLSTAGVRWISRVPDTSKEARTALSVPDDAWQQEGNRCWAANRPAPPGERWLVVRTTQGEERVRTTVRRQVDKTWEQWEKALWHLGNQRFACAPDAQAALEKQLKKRPAWLRVQAQVVEHPKHGQPGRPRTGAPPDRTEWHIQATLAVDEAAVAQAVRRQASFLVATNVLDPTQLSDQELIQTYQDQHSVERGFAFLKDPLFLASSVFVKKPERIVALSLIMVLCLLVYRLAEYRLRDQLARRHGQRTSGVDHHDAGEPLRIGARLPRRRKEIESGVLDVVLERCHDRLLVRKRLDSRLS